MLSSVAGVLSFAFLLPANCAKTLGQNRFADPNRQPEKIIRRRCGSRYNKTHISLHHSQDSNCLSFFSERMYARGSCASSEGKKQAEGIV
jgi:hypothetical protein